SISLMTSPIIDLTSRPESPKVHQQFKATTTDTTTTITTTLPPPQAQQQSTAEAMMVKRIGVDCYPIASGSQPMHHVKPNRISPAKGDTKLPIDDQPRKNKSHLRTSTHKMADVNAPSDQTSIMAPPVRVDDQIPPHIRFHPRPDSPLHMSNEEPVLGYLKFSAK
nr:hypothetical protein [Tanacetum cinerariifolium]